MKNEKVYSIDGRIFKDSDGMIEAMEGMVLFGGAQIGEIMKVSAGYASEGGKIKDVKKVEIKITSLDGDFMVI